MEPIIKFKFDIINLLRKTYVHKTLKFALAAEKNNARSLED